MDISELRREFDFVDTVSVERTEAGNIDLKMPQHRYEQSDEIPVHEYGWGPFCKMFLDTIDYQEMEAVYVFTANHEIVYVGQTVDLHKRMQAQYSNISPRNCFEGGQQTNCQINALILKAIRKGGQVALWTTETDRRKQLEKELIRECNPSWNKHASPPDEPESSSSVEATPSFDGKYGPLYDRLDEEEDDIVVFTFAELEGIIGDSLPFSATEYEVWWNPTGHSHAEGWDSLGWSADPDLENRTVTFTKIGV